MNLLNNKYLKIVLLLGVAYIISDFSINNLFLAESPRINPFAAQKIIAKVSNLWSKTANLIAFKNINIYKFDNNSTNNSDNFSQSTNNQASVTFQNKNSFPENIKEALTAPLQKVSQGVYAGEKNDIKIFEVRMGELEYLEYTFNVNGKEIKIKVPKGQEQPSQEVLNLLYK